MTDTSGYEVREALANDIPQITSLYAHYVRTHAATFEIEPPDAAEMHSRYATLRAAEYPYRVAVEGGVVLGYCYIGVYRTRIAYAHTAENAVYVAPGAARRGIGAALLNDCLAACPARGIREVIAVIGDSANLPSIALHRHCGFRHIGTLENVGFKFSRWIDTVMMQYSVPPQRR